ncbi:UPF0390 protein zgc136864 [Neodiprion pinetum]|uniref:Uncharacterized protein LOC107226128 n=1 Tax=Neodiprion lecontei TaxID=441921 RepID=A0A6J0C7F5_NEOLC|nr:uncharacterized protein LOC107226128 [Neodiprion lecontei]XP_046425857.1 uncharacterized protein LOC124182511 [Neodiprion fabricii]XP_046481940.1 uncharacterized protein LOC124218978 [Neodiprion pinetum]
MAQGKLKVKAKLPASAKPKGGGNKNNNNNKGRPIQRRGNAPVRPKKAKFEEQNKLKKIISKTVNKAMEQELRQRALGGKQSLTKKEPASSSSGQKK